MNSRRALFLFWFVLCFIFLIFNLKLLNDDSKLVSYMIVEETDKLYENTDESTKFLLCFPLNKVRKKDKLINKLDLNNQSFSVQNIQNCVIESRWSSSDAIDSSKLNENYLVNRNLLNVSAQNFINCLIKSIEANLNTTGLLKMNDNYVFYDDDVIIPASIFFDYLLALIADWNIIDESSNFKTKPNYFHENNLNVSAIEFLDYSFKTIESFSNRKRIIKIQDNQLIYERNVNVSAKFFINYAIKSVENNLNSTKTFKMNETFVFYNAICFLANKNDLETAKPFNGTLGYYPSTYLYLQLKGRQLIYSEYSYQKYNTNNFYNNLNIRKSKVYNQKYLKDSNCVNVAAKLTSDRINCVNSCSDKVGGKIGFYDYQNKKKFSLARVMNNRNEIQSESDNKKSFNNSKIENATKSPDILMKMTNNTANSSQIESVLTERKDSNKTKNVDSILDVEFLNITRKANKSTGIMQVDKNKQDTLKLASKITVGFDKLSKSRKKSSGIVSTTKLIGPEKYKTLKKCINKCPYKFCEFETHNALQTKYNGQKAKTDHKIKINNYIYVASYIIDDFWLQVFGLVSLISGVSLLSILTSSVVVLSDKVKNHNHQNKYFRVIFYHGFFKFFSSKFKYVILSFVSVFIVFKSYYMYDAYDIKTNYPNKTGYISYSSNLPNIIICFPIEKLVFPNESLLDNKRNSALLNNFTFGEIETITNSTYQQLIKSIKLVYGNKIRNNLFKWRVNKKKTYFRFGRLEKANYNYLSRCFRIELEYDNNLRYEVLNPIHYLKIKFNTRWWNLFVLDQDQKFQLNLTEIKYGFSIRKVEIRNSNSEKINCTNFEKDERFVGLNCASKIDCINRCINALFINKHNSLPVYSLIDKDDFAFSLSAFKFNKIKDYEIEEACTKALKKFKDCNEIRYEETFKLTSIYDNDRLRLNLNYEYYHEVEIKTSKTKLLLDILNLVSIIFGTNIIGLLMFIIRVKIARTKLFRLLILAICFFGFIVQIILIFNSIINEELVHSLYFKKLSNYTLPSFLICFDLPKSIDHNHMLNGDYLNELSNDFMLENVIHNIQYFNITDDNRIEPNGTGFSNNEISIDTLYFLNFKCFEIKLHVRYNENDLLILDDKYKMLITLQKSFINGSKILYLLYRHPDSNRFSDLLEYEFLKNSYYKDYTSYEINFELNQIDIEDKFELLKDPTKLFYKRRNLNDTTVYLNEMKKNFRTISNRTTREILLNEDDFEYEIDDGELFKQYYLQVQNHSDYEYPNSMNLKINYYDCLTKQTWDPHHYIKLNLLSEIKKIEITNNENYTKLIISILNSLSLWFDIALLDCFICINYIHKFFIFLYYLLIKIEIILRKILVKT